jgi:hypothetical protein
MHEILRATTLLLFVGFPLGAWVGAMPLNRICTFYEYPRVRERKTCVVDFWNSGNVQITTNNGTLNFMLRDSRNDTYTLNGKVWFLNGGYDSGEFKSLDEPIRYVRFGDY